MATALRIDSRNAASPMELDLPHGDQRLSVRAG